MPDPLISSAFVRIKAEPKSVSAFSKEVRASIEKSLVARPIKVPVIARLTPFRKQIQTQLTAKPFTIQVVPVLAPGFKATVSRLAKTAAAGVTVPVTPVGRAPLVPVGGTRAPVAAAASTRASVSTAASREAAFQKKLNDLALSRAAVTRQLTKAEQTEGTVKERLVAADRALSKAESVLEKHLVAQDAILSSLTKKQQAKLATTIRAAQADVTAAAEGKALLASTIAQSEADLKRETTSKLVADLDVRRIAVEAELTAVQNAGALATNEIGAARARLSASTSVLTAAEALHRDVLLTEDVALQSTTASLLEKATADEVARRSAVATAIADNDAAAAALKRAAAQKSLEKGLLATALAAAGARGATLAASFEFLAGAAIATGLFKSIQLAERLQTELNVFRVTAGATAVEMDKVSAAAKRLGADITLPSVSANDAADAMTELAKAGLSVNDSIDAARGTLQLATAAQLDNATAVNITASALNAFGLAGNQAVHVADLLAGSANAAQGGIGDMGQSLSSVASVARQAGLSIEDTVALITLLAKNGIQGAEGGTALRVAIIRLIAPTKDAREELEKLNIAVLDSAGNLRPQVFSDIADATSKLGASQRNAALQTIFGTRAIRAQAVIGREGVEGLNAMRDATNQQGAAAKLAAARTAGFAGDIEALKNATATLGLALGESLIPTLSGVVQNLSEVASGAIDATDALKKFNDAIPGSGGGILPDLSPGFDPGLFDPGLKGISARIKEIRASVELVKQGNLGKSLTEGITGDFSLPSEQVAKFSHEAEIATVSADDLAVALKGLSFKQGGGPVGAQLDFLKDLRKQITGTGDDADAARARLDALIRLTIALGRSPTALEIKVLFQKGSVDQSLIEAQRRINQSRLNIQLGIDQKSVVFLGNSAKDAAGVAAQDAQKQFATIFGDQMAASPLGRAQWDPFFLNANTAGQDAGKSAAAAFASAFDTQVAVLEATGGSDSAILSVLQAQLARRQNLLARAQAKFKADPTKANDAFVQRAAGLVSETQGKIKDITTKQASDAKDAADKIASARDKADQAFLDALGLKRGRIENAILRAEGTASLNDDIKTNTQLRNLIRRKIEEASKTIKDAQLRATTIQSLTADLIAQNQKLRDLNTQLITSISERFQARIDVAQIIGTVGSIRKIYAEWIDALQKALREATKGSKIAKELKLAILKTQQSAFDAINEGFDLDIQIAQAQERPRAEIRARERFIEQLRREQAQFRKGSLEWKRLQLEIVQQRKAIEAADKALKDMNNATAQMQFTFLQTQAGFAANLLGNLIPGFATGGLVGGTTPSGGGAAAAGALRQVAGGFEQPRKTLPGHGPSISGGAVPTGGGGGGVIGSFGEDPGKAVSAQSVTVAGGPTRGGQARELHLLQQIVTLLHHIYRGTGHPEAKHTRATGANANSGAGGGGGGADFM